MTVDYPAWAAQVRRLCRALETLRPVAESVGVPSPEGEEWFELLVRKLLPQLDAEPVLVVAIVGGTNIGKSVIFNHLASELASGVSPLAAGTRNPVCLVPAGLDEAVLAGLFDPFQLRRWQSPADPLEDSPEHRLFWRAGRHAPPRLLLLDTPDIDSDAAVNWQRADSVRQTADVLVAVLTQQKYNDAAVKQFFRKAVEADKPIVVIFNQCDLEADREFWPEWLATFTRETGARPELVYVIPYDRTAAHELRLPFFDVGRDGREPPAPSASLRDELASLHFDEIKIRTFRGAMARVLSHSRGLVSYLDRVRSAGGQFDAAAKALSEKEMARMEWPDLPADLLVEEICRWWDAGRNPWSRQVHGLYRAVGQGVTWPARAAWRALAGPTMDPLAEFQSRERGAVVRAVEGVFDQLERLAKVGNETLRPRLLALLKGDKRARLLRKVEAAHAELPAMDDDYRAFLRDELDAWGRENPRAVGFLRSVDHLAAIARPAITVSLAVSGWVLAGDLVGQAAAHVVGHTASEVAIAGAITGGGETLVSTTGEGVKQAAARLFGRLRSGYARQRAGWLAEWLETELLGGLLAELRRGAEVPRGDAFGEVVSATESLSGQSS
ncbi:MAG: GTPase [Pirellulales bacterium]